MAATLNATRPPPRAVGVAASLLLARLLGVAAALFILAALLWVALQREPATLPQTRPEVAARESGPQHPASAAPVRQAEVGDTTANPTQVRGWEGVDADGALALDARGRPIIDLQLRRRFDHVISARGVLTEAQIGELLLQQAARLGFDASQREALRELFERYRRYQSSLGTLQVDSASLPSVRAAHQARQQMRRAMLGVQMAEAFFAQDETEENYALARMEVMQDTSLSPTQRDARLEALRDQLPPELRAMERESRTLERLEARVRALGSTAADPASVYAARAEVVGPDAARRLAELDAEEADWTARMQTLESERRRIRAAADDDAGQQRALAGYLEEHFTPAEQLRARAYLNSVDANAAMEATRADAKQ